MQPVRPILTLVTQTLRDVNALHGDLPDVVKALDDLSTDLLHHAKTPALLSLARTLREHVFHLERAVDAEGVLPKDWAEAIGDLPGLDEEDTSAGIDSVQEMREYAAAANVRVGEAALLREVLEQLGINGDDAHGRFRDWVRDVGAQIERAKGIVDPADKIAGDADALREALDIAENHAGDAADADEAPPTVDLSGELAAARASLAGARARADSAESRLRDGVLARETVEARVRDLLAAVQAARDTLGRVLPDAAPAPAASPLPVSPDHMRLVGHLGLVCDGPFGRFLLNETRSVALLSALRVSRYARPAPVLVCSGGGHTAEGAAELAGMAGEWEAAAAQHARPLVHPADGAEPLVAFTGSPRKLPKASEEVWKIGLVPVEPDETIQWVYFEPGLVRQACTGADDVVIGVIHAGTHADGSKRFILRIVRSDGFVGFVMSRGAPAGG